MLKLNFLKIMILLQVDAIPAEAAASKPDAKSSDGVGLPSWVIHPDMHRVEFVNRVIQQLWPHVESYLVQMLKVSCLNQWLQKL